LIFLRDILKVFGECKVWKEGFWMPLTEGYCKGFDLDLEFGKMGEQFVEDMQLGNKKIEVKTERDIWKTTGNIAIEVRYKGNPSGISTTDSNVWIHLLSYEGKIESGFIFNVGKLKKRIKELLNDKIARLVMGGDDNRSQLVLVPIDKLMDYQRS
tara:strand:- start:328 stop:792 length:465 start_codon:yes stop_codon:yes gene_type:complete